MTTDTDIAWAAGLFEGEGCFRIKEVGRGRYAFAQLATTDRDVLEKFLAIVGVGTIKAWQPPSRNHWKQTWTWATTSRDDFSHVADLLRPWLCERRLAKLDEVERARTPKMRNHSGRRTTKAA